MRSFLVVSWISLFCLLVAAASLAVYFVRTQLRNGVFAHTSHLVLFNPTFERVIASFGNFNTAFFAHPYVAPIAEQMRNPTRSRALRLTWAVNIPGAIFVYSIALLSYLCFSEVAEEVNIFFSLEPYEPEVIVGKFAILGVSLCSTVFFTYFCSQQMASSIHPAAGKSKRMIGTTSFTMMFLSIALYLFGVLIFDGLVYQLGTISFSLLGFVLPPVYYLSDQGFASVKWGCAAVFVLAGGLAFLGMETGITVKEMIGRE
jgi:amino acid permease